MGKRRADEPRGRGWTVSGEEQNSRAAVPKFSSSSSSIGPSGAIGPSDSVDESHAASKIADRAAPKRQLVRSPLGADQSGQREGRSQGFATECGEDSRLFGAFECRGLAVLISY